jgi:hypothetical protein
MRARTVALLALACAGALSIGPSAAFDLTYLSRDASAAIVTDANGYTAISGGTCGVLGATGGTCNTAFTITNKGTTAQYYNLTEDPNNAEISRYRIDGSAWTTTGRVMGPNLVNVGSAINVGLDIASCVACGTRNAYFTVEGEKANILNSMETKVKVVITYT